MDPLADDYLSVQHLSEAARVAAALQSLRCHPRMKRKSRCQKANQERHPVNKAGGKAKGKIWDKLNNLVLPDKATYARLRDFLTQFSPVAQSCLTLCDPMNCSTPGLPVHHQLPESTQTHVHRVGDAIQPSHPLLSLSPPALKLSQHQGLFK